MNAIMSYYFLSQNYKGDYILFIKMKNDLKHASPDAIHTTHLSHKIGNHLEVKNRTPHFTAVIIALHVYYEIE